MMDAMTKEACRLLFECLDELRIHDNDLGHETSPVLKERVQAFTIKYGLDTPEKVVEKLCD